MSKILKDCLERFNPAAVSSETPTGTVRGKNARTKLLGAAKTAMIATSLSRTKPDASAASPSMQVPDTTSTATSADSATQCTRKEGMPADEHMSQSNMELPPANFSALRVTLSENTSINDNVETTYSSPELADNFLFGLNDDNNTDN